VFKLLVNLLVVGAKNLESDVSPYAVRSRTLSFFLKSDENWLEVSDLPINLNTARFFKSIYGLSICGFITILKILKDEFKKFNLLIIWALQLS
jgi:hypothetical protein